MKDEPSMLLAVRVAIVTRSGGYIGRFHARLFAGHAAKVVVDDLTQDASDQVAAGYSANGNDSPACAASVTGSPVGTIVARVLDMRGRGGFGNCSRVGVALAQRRIGIADDVGERVITHRNEISDRMEGMVRGHGFFRAKREHARAAMATPTMAAQ